MRTVNADIITHEVARLCREAACDLPADVEQALHQARDTEASALGRWALEKICDNIEVARESGVALCQDTGMTLVFADVGQDVHIEGALLEDAINAGVAQGYTDGYLRTSMVSDPLFNRVNTGDNTPALVHVRLVAGDCLRLTVLPKGAGSENMTSLGMLKPADGVAGVKAFVLDAVKRAGGNPCPPTIVGVGVGGNAEGALLLSKRALCRATGGANPDSAYAELEARLLDEINATGIGPQGFGGTTTALAVHVEAAPTHIAMLPVAVTLNCHAARHKTVEL